jgi:hypothetical protein
MTTRFDSKTAADDSKDEQSPFLLRLREISMFFDGTDRVHQAMRKIAALFGERQIAYVIIGGMAVNAHGHRRTTGDVDFLIRPESLAAVKQMVQDGVLRRDPSRARRFYEVTTDVRIDVLLAGGFPGSGRPGPIAFPDPQSASETLDNLLFVKLPMLIELKLAAHRHQDFADVVSLIAEKNLSESFMSQLHPSVHADFIECLEEKRREDDYERRQDEGLP